MTASRRAAAVAISVLVSLAVPAAGWAEATRCGGSGECRASAAEADPDDRLPSTSSRPPGAARITGPLASLPGADEASFTREDAVVPAASALIAIGVVAATAGLSLALVGRRPVSSR